MTSAAREAPLTAIHTAGAREPVRACAEPPAKDWLRDVFGWSYCSAAAVRGLGGAGLRGNRKYLVTGTQSSSGESRGETYLVGGIWTENWNPRSVRGPGARTIPCALQMTVHNLYLFDRNGVCLHYSEWHRKKQAGIPKEEEYKLMYGMLFSIRSFVSKMSPLDMKDGFLAFQTSRYKLHYYETPTGIKVVMNTDLGVGPIRDVLHHIYSALYVELVVKNPLCPLGQTVQSELFRSRLDSYVRSLPFFSARAG